MTNLTDFEARLERIYASPMPPEARARIAQVVVEAAAPNPAPSRFRMPRVVTVPLVSLGLALLAVLGSFLGYNHLASPTPASASQILHRAAAALAPPTNAVVHETSVWTYGPGAQDWVSADVWTAVDSNGNPMAAALRHRLPDGTLQYVEVLEASGTFWTYDPPSKTVWRSTWTPGQPLFVPPPAKDPMAILYLAKQTMNSPQSPAATRALLDQAAQGKDATLLPDQTIDGHSVHLVQITRSDQDPAGSSTVITIYIDASSYLIRRVEMRGVDSSGATLSDSHLDVTSYDVVSPSQVPSGTFSFTPPPGSHAPQTTSAPPPSGQSPSKQPEKP